MLDLKRRALALIGFAALLAAAGCGGIPTSGPVHAGTELDVGPQVRALGIPPADGATPEQIIQGFLRDQPGLDDDAAYAREFLAGPIAQTWATLPSVVVYPDESSLTIAVAADGSATVTIPEVATINADGVYTAAAAGTKVVVHLRLARVDRQWRIVSLAPAQTRWLTGYDLDRAYASVALYYTVPGSHILVPDVRWYPATPGLATAIARGQLEPPSAYLAAAVTSAIPLGTSLGVGVDSVPSNGGVATVALSGVTLRVGVGARLTMTAQLAAAVLQAPGVAKVRVTFGGTQLQQDNADNGVTPVELGYTTEPLVTSDPVTFSSDGHTTKLTQLVDNGQPDSLRRPAQLPTLAVDMQTLAVSTGGREYAGTTADDTELVRVPAGHEPVVVLRGTSLTRPSYDPQGWLWTATSDKTSGAHLHAVRTGQEIPATPVQAVTVSAPWLAGRTVTALRISRDGARALVVSSGRGGWRIDLAGITRDATGRPTALSTPLRLAVGFSDVTDATWVDAMTVAVLGRTGTDTSAQPYLIGIGAEVSPLPTIKNAVAITAGTGAATVDVVTSSGRIYGGGATGWIQIASGRGVAFPG